MPVMRLLSRIQLLFFITLSIIGIGIAQAQSALYYAANNYLKKRADAFMTITGYSLTPDVTTGSLSIRNKDGDNSDLQMISLGGGSHHHPKYCEP
jgi:hypothetical protein